MAEIRAIDLATKRFNRAMIGSSVLLFGVLALWLGLTGDADPPYFNVAFTTSWILGCAGIAVLLAYARRRPPGAPVTWGGAMLGATASFFLMFWIYGVVPHWWLVFADSELNWRADRMLVGPALPGLVGAGAEPAAVGPAVRPDVPGGSGRRGRCHLRSGARRAGRPARHVAEPRPVARGGAGTCVAVRTAPGAGWS